MGTTVCPSIAKKLGSDAAIQGVDYTASIASNASGGGPGGKVMADLIKMAKQKCPGTKVAIAGYSQGGMVVHRALSSAGDDVSVAVTYGDPFQRAKITKVPAKQYCATGDGVCLTGGFAITPGHLAYTTNGDTTKGAEFIKQNTQGGSGSSSGASSSDSGSDSSDSSDSDSSSSGGRLSSLLGGGGSSMVGGLGSLLGGGSSGSDSSSSSADSGDDSSADTSSGTDDSSDDSSSGSGSSSLLSGLMGGSRLGKLAGLMGKTEVNAI